MYRVLIFLFLFAVHADLANAQQLLNGGFEDILIADSPHNFPVPEYWEMVFPQLEFSSGTLSSESHNGEWAVKLETRSQLGLRPGKLSTLFYSSQLISSIIGHPLNDTPNQLSLYYKYLPEGGDTARVSVLLFNFPDTVPFFEPFLSYTDTLFYLQQDIVNESVSYTQLLLDLEYSSDTAPEYVAVNFLTNKHASEFGVLNSDHGNSGTTLWVDDIELLYSVSSTEERVSKPDISLYPIPVSEFFQIQKPLDLNIEKANLYDVSGKQRLVLDPDLNRHTIGHLPRGMYLLHLSYDRGQTILKLLKQ